MIQQLILSVLLACDQQEKTAIETTVVSKPKKPAGKIVLVDKLSTSTPSALSDPATNFYSTSVHLSHIPYPRASFNDDLFCTYICNYANNGRGTNITKVENCWVELLSNWEEQRKDLTWEEITQKGDTIVGNVECNGYFIQTMIKGRLGLSKTRGSNVSDDLGGYFARFAQEEVTAVFAFQEMLQNLKSFGAPQKLLDDCERAICDEKRHTIMMSNMAKHHGCESVTVDIPAQKLVSLFEFAKHNAIAGCIGETWSALAIEYRSKHTKQYAKLFRAIAKDEIFHAQLSWDIHQWLRTKLSEKEQVIIENFMIRELNTLPETASNFTDLGDIPPSIHKQLWSEFRSQIEIQLSQRSA